MGRTHSISETAWVSCVKAGKHRVLSFGIDRRAPGKAFHLRGGLRAFSDGVCRAPGGGLRLQGPLTTPRGIVSRAAREKRIQGRCNKRRIVVKGPFLWENKIPSDKKNKSLVQRG